MAPLIPILLSLLYNVIAHFTVEEVHLADINIFIVNHLTVVESVGNAPGIIFRGVKGKASLKDNENLDIHQADVELIFTSYEAAESCWSSVKALKEHVFLTYLTSPRLEDVVQLRR